MKGLIFFKQNIGAYLKDVLSDCRLADKEGLLDAGLYAEGTPVSGVTFLPAADKRIARAGACVTMT